MNQRHLERMMSVAQEPGARFVIEVSASGKKSRLDLDQDEFIRVIDGLQTIFTDPTPETDGSENDNTHNTSLGDY